MDSYAAECVHVNCICMCIVFDLSSCMTNHMESLAPNNHSSRLYDFRAPNPFSSTTILT